METINERIALAFAESKLSQAKIAQQLKMSTAMISMLATGKAKPSERTVQQIANELHVSEGWLLTGEGEMKPARTRNQSIMLAINDILADEDDSFRKRWIEILSNLSAEEWAILKQISDKLLENKEKPL